MSCSGSALNESYSFSFGDELPTLFCSIPVESALAATLL